MLIIKVLSKITWPLVCGNVYLLKVYPLVDNNSKSKTDLSLFTVLTIKPLLDPLCKTFNSPGSISEVITVSLLILTFLVINVF
jgi:hypothetical protein